MGGLERETCNEQFVSFEVGHANGVSKGGGRDWVAFGASDRVTSQLPRSTRSSMRARISA